MKEIDTLIEARWVIPVEPGKLVLHHHAIAIDNGIIQAILPVTEVPSKFTAKNTVKLNEHALIPGLINLHTHAAMSLMRGIADDLPLMEWLNQHIWPTESRHVNEQFVYDGTRLACAEMISGGITCFNDMYFFPEAGAKAALESGMRAALGMIAIDFPTNYANDADDYLTKGLALRDQFRQNSLLSFCFAPHAPYTVSDQTLLKVITYAEQLDVPIHIHLHETQDEINIDMKAHGVRPIERLHKLGLLDPSFIGVHMVRMNQHEIELISRQNCHVAHCPSSNMKLASGFAAITKFLDHNINVGLGTDSAASNNRLDLFEEMRLAALIAKAECGKADAMPAHQALEMATLNGAKALGLDNITGSLAVGKAADITAVDFSDLNLSPCFDPISHLVYSAGREHVTHVWVNGNMLLSDRQLMTLDQVELKNRTAFWYECIHTTNQ